MDISSSFINYNSRSSAESDANRKNVHFKFFATTPALLRRATSRLEAQAFFLFATTHALLRRATGMSNPFESVGKCYNSRSPAESDLDYQIDEARL